MNWQDIKASTDNTHFLFKGQPIFDKKFIEVLKFHSPGLAPVKDKSGSYHIDALGNQLYTDRYSRCFGFYCNRATVVQVDQWFHITDKGDRAYKQTYNWTGNYQESICTVRDHQNQYFHIDLNGYRIYKENYVYAGDYKDGIACVKLKNGLFKHIDIKGDFINNKSFIDLGVFHKGFATARDEKGWFHINCKGKEIYNKRYAIVEPFYNGFAVVTGFNLEKSIINENGSKVIFI